MNFYRDIEPGAVSLSLRSASDDAVTLAAKELSINRPSIQWFEPSDGPEGAWKCPQDAKGEARARHPEKIWLNRLQCVQEAVTTIGHELRHLWQWKHGHLPQAQIQMTRTTTTAAEADAELFGKAFRGRYFSGTAGTTREVRFVRADPKMAELIREAQGLLGWPGPDIPPENRE